jgi:hypothetical protein
MEYLSNSTCPSLHILLSCVSLCNYVLYEFWTISATPAFRTLVDLEYGNLPIPPVTRRREVRTSVCSRMTSGHSTSPSAKAVRNSSGRSRVVSNSIFPVAMSSSTKTRVESEHHGEVGVVVRALALTAALATAEEWGFVLFFLFLGVFSRRTWTQRHGFEILLLNSCLSHW